MNEMSGNEEQTSSILRRNENSRLIRSEGYGRVYDDEERDTRHVQTERAAYLGEEASNNNDGGGLEHVPQFVTSTRSVHFDTTSLASNTYDEEVTTPGKICGVPTLRRIALELSLYTNIIITFAKLVTYIRTSSLSVLAALVDSVLDVVSQLVLYYTEKHSSMSRSSALYPAGAARLEPIGVLTCAALMGMASFEVLKESFVELFFKQRSFEDVNMSSFWSMMSIVVVKLGLLWLCNRAARKRTTGGQVDDASDASVNVITADPTLEALAQDHLNDTLSNGVAAVALVFVLHWNNLWFLDPIGALIISIYIIYSWFVKGKEQIEHLTGRSAPEELIEELVDIASRFDARLQVDHIRAYHFGPKFLVELEVVMHKDTLLSESHDLGMELQYQIEAREEVERCFVHIDYEARPYDEHVVSKVPELLEKYRPARVQSGNSV